MLMMFLSVFYRIERVNNTAIHNIGLQRLRRAGRQQLLRLPLLLSNVDIKVELIKSEVIFIFRNNCRSFASSYNYISLALLASEASAMLCGYWYTFLRKFSLPSKSFLTGYGSAGLCSGNYNAFITHTDDLTSCPYTSLPDSHLSHK